MAFLRVDAQLVNAEFPFNFRELSRTVIFADQKKTIRGAPSGFLGNQGEQQFGVPQAYYMDNVVPISRGYTSVSYKEILPQSPVVQGNIIFQGQLQGEAGELAFFVNTVEGQYILDVGTETWHDVTVGYGADVVATIANVLGASYVFLRGYGLYRYDYQNFVLEPVEAKGLDIGNIIGMVGAGNMLVFWDLHSTFFWSSYLDPLDFVPSLATGAGSSNVVAITSRIVTCEPYGEDFLIYTRNNVVAARQTGDINFPFVFREVVGSNGIWDRTHVGVPPTANAHVAWTNTGFQQITLEQATPIWPELRDGITRGIRITFDEFQGQPLLEHGPIPTVRIAFCSSNFVCISLRYEGEADFTEAYIFDILLGRWGRLKIPHQYIIENPIVRIFGAYTYADLRADYATYGDLRNNGNRYFEITSRVDTTAGDPGIRFGIFQSTGVLWQGAPFEAETRIYTQDSPGSVPRIFLGKYKIDERNSISLDSVALTRLHNGTVRAHGHLQNGSFVSVVDTSKELRQQPGVYAIKAEADSVSIEVEGSFVLTSVAFDCHTAGHGYAHGTERSKKYSSYIVSYNFPLYVADPEDAALPVSACQLEDMEIRKLVHNITQDYREDTVFAATACILEELFIQPVTYRLSVNDSQDVGLPATSCTLDALDVTPVVYRIADTGSENIVYAATEMALEDLEVVRQVVRMPVEQTLLGDVALPATNMTLDSLELLP